MSLLPLIHIFFCLFYSIRFPPIGPDSPGESNQIPHPALPAAAGEAVPGKAWLSGVELALPQPVL